MSRKTYNKLIRDRVPEIIKDKGAYPTVSILSRDSLVHELKNKLIEEAGEVKQARNREEIINEIADVVEVVHSLADSLSLSLDEVEKRRTEKRADRGGLEKRLFLKYVDDQK